MRTSRTSVQSIARLIGTLALLLWALASTAQAQPASPVQNSWITFIRAGNVWVMNPAGSNQRQVTQTGGCSHPSWSPDGMKLAFSATLGEVSTLYIISRDGSDLKRLTNGPTSDQNPEWSPDGKQILFSRCHDYESDIYLLKLDDSSVTPVVTGPTFDFDASWNPDGRRIIFARSSDHDSGGAWICIANADGTGIRDALGLGGRCEDPHFSPDGRQIAFQCLRDCWQIIVCGSDASGMRSITARGLNCNDPTWSPDSKCIAFSQGIDAPQIRAIETPALSTRVVAERGGQPAWSPKQVLAGLSASAPAAVEAKQQPEKGGGNGQASATTAIHSAESPGPSKIAAWVKIDDEAWLCTIGDDGSAPVRVLRMYLANPPGSRRDDEMCSNFEPLVWTSASKLIYMNRSNLWLHDFTANSDRQITFEQGAVRPDCVVYNRNRNEIYYRVSRNSGLGADRFAFKVTKLGDLATQAVPVKWVFITDAAGDVIYGENDDCQIRSLNLRTGEERLVVAPNKAGDSLGQATVSPDGQTLLYFHERNIYQAGLDGNGARAIAGPGQEPACSPSGRWISYSNYRRLHPNKDQFEIWLTGLAGNAKMVDVSEDGCLAWGWTSSNLLVYSKGFTQDVDSRVCLNVFDPVTSTTRKLFGRVAHAAPCRWPQTDVAD